MEKIIIFNDNDDGSTLYVVKVYNWDERFGSVVNMAKEKWNSSHNELFGILMDEVRKAGYKTKILPYEEILI